jgi:hypothetical protein
MKVQRIYADFNGLVRGPRNPDRTAVVLDTFGSLRDLSNAGSYSGKDCHSLPSTGPTKRRTLKDTELLNSTT